MYEIVELEVSERLDHRGATEKAAERILSARVDMLRKSQRVPFWKPMAEYRLREPRGDWTGLLDFVREENRRYRTAISVAMFCSIHRSGYQLMEHNHTDTYGCQRYPNPKSICPNGHTLYKDGVHERLSILQNGLCHVSRNRLLDYVAENGPDGCPDFVALKDSTLWFIEVKSRRERVSERQLAYLEWCQGNGGRGILLRVVEAPREGA